MEIDYWEMFFKTLSVFLTMWPLWLIFLIVIVMTVFFKRLSLKADRWLNQKKFKKGAEWRSDRDRLQWLRGMKPSEFEEYIAELFAKLGYQTQAVGKSHDKGIDVIAKKDGTTYYIQCKKYISSSVSLGAVRDFYGALADHLANGQGYLVTTNKFTLEARQFAEDKPIELIDGYGLIRYIKMAEKTNGKGVRD